MHVSALENAQRFAECYLTAEQEKVGRIVEIGSQIIANQKSLRDVFESRCRQYVGLDFANALGVDIILSDPYQLPLDVDYADVVISSSCFEHAEFFWLSFLEIVRICKPGGLIYINAPSNGMFHRYPVDCWRFYPDSGVALQNWANRNNSPVVLLESYISNQKNDCWNDFVGVWAKGDQSPPRYQRRIVDTFSDFTNGLRTGATSFIHPTANTEDMARRILGGQMMSSNFSVKWY